MGPPDGYEAPAPITLHVEAERPADAMFAILVSATMRVVCSTVYVLLLRLSPIDLYCVFSSSARFCRNRGQSDKWIDVMCSEDMDIDDGRTRALIPSSV